MAGGPTVPAAIIRFAEMPSALNYPPRDPYFRLSWVTQGALRSTIAIGETVYAGIPAALRPQGESDQPG